MPVDAYRGAGRPEATYVVERLVHQAGVDLGIPQDEIRRRNFIRTFPYATPVALTYDTGNYDATLDEAMKIADVAGFPARKAQSRQATASCAASAIRRTSRPAASRPRTSPARSARGRACSRRDRCA